MTADRVFESLRKVLVCEFRLPEEQVTPGAQLVDDLDLDSVDAVAMVVRLEEETGLLLGEEDLRTLATVQDVVDLIQRRSSRPAP